MEELRKLKEAMRVVGLGGVAAGGLAVSEEGFAGGCDSCDPGCSSCQTCATGTSNAKQEIDADAVSGVDINLG